MTTATKRKQNRWKKANEKSAAEEARKLAAAAAENRKLAAAEEEAAKAAAKAEEEAAKAEEEAAKAEEEAAAAAEPADEEDDEFFNAEDEVQVQDASFQYDDLQNLSFDNSPGLLTLQGNRAPAAAAAAASTPRKSKFLIHHAPQSDHDDEDEEDTKTNDDDFMQEVPDIRVEKLRRELDSLSEKKLVTKGISMFGYALAFTIGSHHGPDAAAPAGDEFFDAEDEDGQSDAEDEFNDLRPNYDIVEPAGAPAQGFLARAGSFVLESMKVGLGSVLVYLPLRLAYLAHISANNKKIAVEEAAKAEAASEANSIQPVCEETVADNVTVAESNATVEAVPESNSTASESNATVEAAPVANSIQPVCEETVADNVTVAESNATVAESNATVEEEAAVEVAPVEAAPVANSTASESNATVEEEAAVEVAPVANATVEEAATVAESNATVAAAVEAAPVANSTASESNATVAESNATVEAAAVEKKAEAAESVLAAMDKYLPEGCSNGFFKRDKNIQMKDCNKLAFEWKCNQGIEHFNDVEIVCEGTSYEAEYADRVNEYSPIIGKLEAIQEHIEC